jgi:hypothetical protein
MGIRIHGSDLDKLGILRFSDPRVAMDAQVIEDIDMPKLVRMAQDVALITTGNNGVPAYFTNYIDPKVIEMLTAPLAATEIYEEVQKGGFETDFATFLSVELTGKPAGYGDFAMGGRAGHNANFPQRQAYGFQVITEWGDRAVAISGEAKLDYISLQQKASALTINRRNNEIYLLGVSGLQCYGLMNDPGLISASQPTSETVGGSQKTKWEDKTDVGIYNDVQKLFKLLVAQSKGIITKSDEMVLALPGTCEAELNKQNSFGQVVRDRIAKILPNLKVVNVPEFETESGNLVQLIAKNVQGIPTGETAFCEKMRAHGVIKAHSSFSEKKSSRNLGFVLYRPFAVAQILGI